jgi:hypothetical protein
MPPDYCVFTFDGHEMFRMQDLNVSIDIIRLPRKSAETGKDRKVTGSA